jgi:hypothetical protein
VRAGQPLLGGRGPTLFLDVRALPGVYAPPLRPLPPRVAPSPACAPPAQRPSRRPCPHAQVFSSRVLCSHRSAAFAGPSATSPFELLPSPVPPTPLARSDAGPYPAGPAPPPTPSSPSLDPSLSRPSRPDPRCCDLFGSIRRPFGWIASFRLDPSLPWPSRPDLSFPLLFCRGRGHHDRRRRVRCCRPPWRGFLTPRRSKKKEGRPVGALLLCHPADR